MSDPFSRPGDDPRKGRALGERGMERVALSSGEWFTAAQKVVLRVCQLRPDYELTGEKLGNFCVNVIGEPEKPQVFGALTSWALKQNLIVLLDPPKRVRMEKPRSHARKTDVYRIVRRP